MIPPNYTRSSQMCQRQSIAEKIIPLDQRLRKQYLRVLARNPKSTHLRLLKKAKAEMLQQKVTIKLNKTNARKLQRLAARNNL